MNVKDKYIKWQSSLPEGELLSELNTLIDNASIDELNDRFYKELSFGTAGLRGKIGAGTNRMNYYTVGRATQGIADYIKAQGVDAMKRGVVIAHDSRHFSREFSQLTASILAAGKIHVYVFPDLRPTPQLSYMIPKLNAVSGINITASHNPKEYNGYKVYWEDGCQIGSDIAEAMTEYIDNVDYFADIRRISFSEGIEEGLINILGSEYDRAYLDEIEALAIHKNEELSLSIPLVYTPLNGAGSIPFCQMLKDRNFTNWHIVPEQEKPDPDFTTVGYPNPEDPKAFKYAELLGHRTGAELLMATDPDADRFSIELLGEDGEYHQLNGNQTGYLLVNYILEGHKTANTLPKNGAMVKSIVTSTMSSKIAEAYGVKMYEALTGFKNICGLIPFLNGKNESYLFGYEESVGYAACPLIRDKDGISAGMLIAEAAAYYKKQGRTLFQVLEKLYETYGYYAEDEPCLILEGIEGEARIRRMMEHLRAHPFTFIGARKVSHISDYQNGYPDALNPDNIIPKSNVLRYYLEESEQKDSDTWFAVRPSGTEPKIKFYFYTRQSSRKKALEVNRLIKEDVMTQLMSIQ